MRRDILSNPIVILLLFIVVFIVNTISTMFFIHITLVGLVFLAFLRTIEYRYYYSLFTVVLSFLIIESNQGIPLFSLTIFSLFYYYIVIPYLEKVFSIFRMKNFIHLLWFYIGIIIVYALFWEFQWGITSVIALNLILDIFIAGVFL